MLFVDKFSSSRRILPNVNFSITSHSSNLIMNINNTRYHVLIFSVTAVLYERLLIKLGLYAISSQRTVMGVVNFNFSRSLLKTKYGIIKGAVDELFYQVGMKRVIDHLRHNVPFRLPRVSLL